MLKLNKLIIFCFDCFIYNNYNNIVNIKLGKKPKIKM